MTFQVTIRDSSGDHKPFPFDAILPESAARDVAADGDWEPWDRIELEVDDGRTVSIFEVPRIVAETARVLGDLKLARAFTREFWPEGRITSALVGLTNALKTGEITFKEAEKCAHLLLSQTVDFSARREACDH